MTIARIDCESTAGSMVCKKFNIRGYPTLKVIFAKSRINFDGERGRQSGATGKCARGQCLSAEQVSMLCGSW
jgi:hypothetical protein